MDLYFKYKNWKGEIANRDIAGSKLYFGATEWHKEPQLLLEGIDKSKGEKRTFAVKDMQEFYSTDYFGMPTPKPTIHIYEGCQGAGKTTMSRLHRELQTYTNLISLSGIKDKSERAKSLISGMHYNCMSFVERCWEDNINFVFDRSFFTERCYCLCEYKDYDFEREFSVLINKLNNLLSNYNIIFVLLTADENTLEERLHRNKPQYAGVHFDVENSIEQQNNYLWLLAQLKREYSGIQTLEIDTSNVLPKEAVRFMVDSYIR